MKRNYYLSLGILLVIAVVIGIFTYNTVWLGDDISYAYDYTPGHNDEVVSSIPQIIKSLNTHYLTVNGRHVPHFFVQAFCGMWGHGAFAVCNAVFYIVFLLALCRLCYVKLGNLRGVITVALLALLTFQTKMTPSCQIGYIWTFSVAMIYLLLFFSHRRFDKWWQLVLLSVFSLIAGNGNEAITLGISGALIIYWCTHMRVMSLRQYLMMVFFGLGTLIICLSPGSLGRASNSTGFDVISAYKSITCIFYIFKASFVMIAIILWQVIRNKKSFKAIYKTDAFYFNVWIILFVFNALIGFGANRQVFGAELIAIIISVRLLYLHRFNYFWTCVFSVALIALYIEQGRFIMKVRAGYDEIERQYITSADGKVYVDIDQSNNVPYSMDMTPRIPLYGTYDSGLYEHNLLAKSLRRISPGKADVRIIPTMLRGMEHKHLATQIIPFSQQGNYIIIESDLTPQKIYVERSIDKAWLHRKYDPCVVDINDRTLCEGAHWKARYLSMTEYSILGMSDNSVFIK